MHILIHILFLMSMVQAAISERLLMTHLQDVTTVQFTNYYY